MYRIELLNHFKNENVQSVLPQIIYFSLKNCLKNRRSKHCFLSFFRIQTNIIDTMLAPFIFYNHWADYHESKYYSLSHLQSEMVKAKIENCTRCCWVHNGIYHFTHDVLLPFLFIYYCAGSTLLLLSIGRFYFSFHCSKLFKRIISNTPFH